MTSNDIKKKLAESREFREEFVAALVRRAFSVQVRTIRKHRQMTQEKLAEAAKIEQGVVSRAENPNYGKLTFTTGFRIAAGFDLVFIPRLVTFTEFLRWADEVSEGFTNLPGFEKELSEGTLGKSAKPEAHRKPATELLTFADYAAAGKKKPQRENDLFRAIEGSGQQPLAAGGML